LALTLPLMVDAAIPAVFQADGTNAAAAINQDGTINSESNPAKPGSFVSIWATGVGGTPGLLDGQMVTTAQNSDCCTLYDLANNQQIVPSYAGAAPGLVNGTTQINFQANNGVDFCLVVGGKMSSLFSVFMGVSERSLKHEGPI
jgi:uncharacterized protein (TIGR03437 family)